jgi:hypothetical protein
MVVFINYAVEIFLINVYPDASSGNLVRFSFDEHLPTIELIINTISSNVLSKLLWL